MFLDLKGIREAAKLSDEEARRSGEDKLEISQGRLGERLGLSQAQISRYEADAGTISMELARRWCDECGTTLELELSKAAQRAAAEEDSALSAGEPYADLHRKLGLLEQYVETAPQMDASLPPLSITPEDFQTKIQQWKRKPSVLIAGRFDSGKTRIANTLLGRNRLPSQYQPTTSVATFIRHEVERPKWQREDVWIMGKEFNPSMWNDEISCQRHRLIAGGFETLRRFGIKESGGDALGARYALIYTDAPILHACTLIDVPGYSDHYEEDRTANMSATVADVLIYTAPAKGFLDGADFLHLGLLLRSIRPIHARTSSGICKFSNLFLVATHADPYISDAELASILSRGCTRLLSQFGESILKRQGVSGSELRERFFTFWYETPKRRADLEHAIQLTLSNVMPAQIAKQVDAEVKDIKAKAKESLAAQISAYERAESEYEAAQRAIVHLRKSEPRFRERVRTKKNEVYEKIDSLRQESIAFVHDEIEPTMTEGSIEAFIKAQRWNKEEAKKFAVAKLLEDVQFRLERFLEGESKKLHAIVDEFLKEYSDALAEFDSPELGSFGIPFDAAAAFAGGLAGVGTLGALGLWASMMGNLGGYILVAKLASVLSAVGLGIGSASLVSFVAAIGGPVTLAIGLASIITLGVWALLGDSWQRRLAKKIAKTLEENASLKKYEEGVAAFWEQTWHAFEAGADGMNAKFDQYLVANEQLIDGAKGGSREKIEATIRSLEELRDFFAGIPWRSPA